MPRIEEKKKRLQAASAAEIFGCLQLATLYPKILLNHSSVKPYSEFLKSLLLRNFYKGDKDKVTFKRIAADTKTEPGTASRWIREIYNDIFELNERSPNVFQQEGIKLLLHMKFYDNYCVFATGMPSVPREFESLRFPFIKAKIGLDIFWVKSIEYTLLGSEVEIIVSLEVGFVNKYREFTLEKAAFQGLIGEMDVFQKEPEELNKVIRKFYKG